MSETPDTDTPTRQEKLRAQLRAKRVASGFTLARFARAAGGAPIDWARLEAGLDDAPLSEEIITAIGAMGADFPGEDEDFAAAAEEERLRVERGYEIALGSDPDARAPAPDPEPDDDEAALLKHFRAFDAAGRAELLAHARALTRTQPIR